ncbi:AAA domain-containing protein [Flagelloscypha sp. PMI_526]|nr:AAA domain-containing protein [Flagelloscypha sp. PMI_526]
MAHLNKLAIRGIRSFDDKQIAVIEFFSPVTVIVGHNGSGKTTIIECLKYATTGDQPPNTRGGAFVHDPKMANEKEVKAQVKLRFHAANGKRMLAVRNLSVSVKKTAGLTMKTLESILALADGEEKGGKRGVISTKCAEMDSEIPQLLGVSKSVLENVIFCHQEDSYWPLAEPSILKKKFDDIFEATKYTKALDNIKALRKDRVAELKAEKERLEGLKREKGHADKLKERMEDLEKEIATKDADHTRLNHEHETIMMKNKSFFEKGTQFRDIFTKVDALEQQLEKAQADFHETKDSIQILPDTENELKLRISTFESNINKKKMERKERDAELNQAERDQIKAQGEHTELVTRKGSLQAQADAQAQRINEREQLIREIAVKYGIKLKDAGGGPMERSQIVEFSQNLEAATRKAKEDHTGLMTKLRAVTNDYNDKLAGLERTLQAYISQKQIHRESMSTNTSKIATLQRMLDDQDSLALQLETLNGDLEDKQAKVNKLREEIKKAKYEDRIIEKSQAIRSLNDQKDALNAEFASLSSQANVRAKLDLKRQEVKSKGSEIKSLVDASSSRFKKLVGSNIKPETMERDLDQLQRIKEQEREELEDVQKDSGRALQLVESSLINARSRLKSRQGELQSLQSKIKKALSEDPNFEGFDNVQAAIEDADKQIGNIRTSLGELKGSGEIFVRMLAEGQKSHSCPTCTQSLKQKAAMDAFVKKMQDEQRKRSKERIAEEEEDLRGWAEGLDILQALVPDENAAKRIKENDVPTLEREIKEQEKQMPQLNDAAEKASESLAAIVKDLKDIAALKTQASSITRLHREVAAAQSEISSLETQLAATGSTKTADDVQNEIDNLGTQMYVRPSVYVPFC